MGKIHKLSPQLADMIAAGEVVERPASVIKELVENAIDAGAKKITVEIQNGGITFMRVTDDGCGMSQEDAPTAFLRHATSKISCAEDLGGIATMGFRGEALAAISAVSKIDLLTHAEGADLGVSIRVEAGDVVDVQSAGCPQGTTMIVRDLFYNTPARMKFLKRDSVEGSYIGGAVQRQALGHPEIAFRFLREGKVELSTPGDGKLLSAIYAAMGRQSAKEMVPVQLTANGIMVTGYVGKPTANRGSRSYQHFFVNGRYVKSRTMTAALEEAYKNQMMVGRFPICVLHVSLPPTAVDVNVHPAKTEVKFLRESDVFDAVRYGVLGALNQAPAKPEMTLPKPQKPANPVSAPSKPQNGFFKTVSSQEYRAMTGLLEKSAQVTPAPAFSRELEALQSKAEVRATPLHVQDSVSAGAVLSQKPPVDAGTSFVVHHTAPVPEPQPQVVPAPVEPTPEPMEQTSMPLPAPEMPKVPEPSQVQAAKNAPEAPYRIIGQALDTYIIVEQGDGLLLIDKHAAHERILFERLKAQSHEIMSQLLLSPQRLSLSQEETAILLEQLDVLESLGFTLEDFGDGDLLLRAVPADIDPQDAPACLSELAGQLLTGKRPDKDAVFDELLHTVACKAAIKGGRKSDPLELSSLVAELMSRDDIKYCPHGRPVCISLSRKTIERQFKRT
jgi:DNA mismatch repair protein MutL